MFHERKGNDCFHERKEGGKKKIGRLLGTKAKVTRRENYVKKKFREEKKQKERRTWLKVQVTVSTELWRKGITKSFSFSSEGGPGAWGGLSEGRMCHFLSLDSPLP